MLTALWMLASTVNADDEYLNVYGEALQSCSSDGMALTGWTRSGYCVHHSRDEGSHHICIDMSSLGGNGENQNFCDVTGQSDWCSSEDMPCNEGGNGCSITNWCVCQWAFASYIEKSGGCDNIQSIVCESINQQALFAYQKQVSKWRNHGNAKKYQNALDCLMERCNLDASHLRTTGVSALFSGLRYRSPAEVWTWFVVGSFLTAAGLYYHRTNHRSIQLNQASELVVVNNGSNSALPAAANDGGKLL